jgi:hypothetical protein
LPTPPARSAVVADDVDPVVADGVPDRVPYGILLVLAVETGGDPVVEGKGVPGEPPGRRLTMRIRSSNSRRRLPTNRSAMAFARGARIGVARTSTPAASNTASKTQPNLPSWSRIRNRERLAGVLDVHEHVARELSQPLTRRVCGQPEDPDPAVGVLDDEEPV